MAISVAGLAARLEQPTADLVVRSGRFAGKSLLLLLHGAQSVLQGSRVFKAFYYCKLQLGCTGASCEASITKAG